MDKPEFRLTKKAWVIGASEGIGKAVCIALDSLGIDLIISARSSTPLAELDQTLKKKSTILPLDVEDTDSFISTLTELFDRHTIDYLFFFPGYYEPNNITGLDAAIINKTIHINFRSVIYFLKHSIPYLEQQPHRQLLITASLAGYRGLPSSQPYAATKAAVINLVESAKAEYPHLNIRLINPGFVKTRLTDKNSFAMPHLLSPTKAAEYIIQAINDTSFEIYFPTRLAWALNILRILPYRIYFYITKHYFKKQVNN